jgi:hypothetical protein
MGKEATVADCHPNFVEFNSLITPSLARRDSLVCCRNDIRRAVRRALSGPPLKLDLEFRPQGSFRLGTAVERPNCDIDDGVFFLASDFGLHEPSVELLFELVHRSLSSQGYFCYKRNPCVRIVFANGLRMDLVIFLKRKSGTYYAHRSDGWVKTDPLFLIHWFERRMDADGQLRRLVKYAKIWLDKQPSKMPTGVVMTILLAQNHVHSGRDDLAFVETLKSVQRQLSQEFACRRPTPPVGEDLLCNELDIHQQKWFDQAVEEAIQMGTAAVSMNTSRGLAIDIWRSLFGIRFPTSQGVCFSEQATRSAILDILRPELTGRPDTAPQPLRSVIVTPSVDGGRVVFALGAEPPRLTCSTAGSIAPQVAHESNAN